MVKQIRTIEALESCVGRTPGPRDLKVIDFLDANAINWIAESPCVFISLASGENRNVRVLISSGPAGFVKAESTRFQVPLNTIDHADTIAPGEGWGSLFVIPSQRESLRVNGSVVAVSASDVTIEVSECYLHCAKAFMRSKLWEEYTDATARIDAENEFCAQTRFMLVATSDRELHADLSPKGDPAGQLLYLENGMAWYPDRPGNRRVDGFRNMLSHPELELVALIAGSAQLLRLRGRAELFSDHPMKNRFEMENKPPHLVTKIEIEHISLEDSPALRTAKLWPPAAPAKNFKATDIWKDHSKVSKVNGLEATIARTAVSIPGVLEKGIDWDYKNNLY